MNVIITYYIIGYLSVMAGLPVESKRINILRPKTDLSNFVEPRLDLTLEFWLLTNWTRSVIRPSRCYILSYAESF